MSYGVGETSVRVFFAVWPDEKERTALAPWQASLHEICSGRVMRADTLHSTLVFLGNVGLHRLEALQLAAHEVEVKAFDLSLDAAHYWRHNHIVYAAPNNVPPQLTQLAHDLEVCLLNHHFSLDKHPYKPHVTLLRHVQWNDTPLPEMNKTIWRASDFALMQSAPDKNGANYRVLARFRLL